MSWGGIVRLGLVQAMLGAMVALATSTLNRVMVVELGLPAIVPGALVALHYLVQALRPRFGYGADSGGARTPWILGGVVVLAAGGVLAAASVALMAVQALAGLALAAVAYVAIGGGVGAAGTALLALLARLVAPARRGPAATIVWLMMIAGIALSATLAGRLLVPFSLARLVAVSAGLGGLAVLATAAAVWRMEPPRGSGQANAPAAAGSFGTALRQIWQDPGARRFTLFVFASMLAYSAQELLIEPFAGRVFLLPPGATASLNGLLHAGVLGGMLLVAAGTALSGRRDAAAMRGWTVGGCVASACAVLAVAATGLLGAAMPLRAALLVLGLANGAFAVSAIGAMMGLAHAGRDRQAGTRLGLWGAAQAIAFGLGGLLGTGAVDLAGHVTTTPAAAYGVVFAAEAGLFLVAAWLGLQVFRPATSPTEGRMGDAAIAGGT